MVKIKLDELKKAMETLEKEAISVDVRIKEDGASLKIMATDKSNR